jgi:hypothetical protein
MLGEPTPHEADPVGEWFAFEKGAGKLGGGDGFADVWKRGFFAWEYKGKGKDLKAAYRQLLDYKGRRRFRVASYGPPSVERACSRPRAGVTPRLYPDRAGLTPGPEQKARYPISPAECPRQVSSTAASANCWVPWLTT